MFAPGSTVLSASPRRTACDRGPLYVSVALRRSVDNVRVLADAVQRDFCVQRKSYPFGIDEQHVRIAVEDDVDLFDTGLRVVRMAARLARNIRLRALPVAERGGDDDIVLRGEISEHGALRQPRLGGDFETRVLFIPFFISTPAPSR